MIYSRDNIDVSIAKSQSEFDFQARKTLTGYKNWLRERNIKFTLVYTPVWDTYPSHINLRTEDAVAFKLRFGL